MLFEKKKVEFHLQLFSPLNDAASPPCGEMTEGNWYIQYFILVNENLKNISLKAYSKEYAQIH